MSPIVTPEQLAEIAYTAYVKSLSSTLNLKDTVDFVWSESSAEEKKNWTAAAIAVRDKVEQFWAFHLNFEKITEDEKTADRFREAVEIAFRQMSIRSTAETAAWYTLRDWLKE